MDFRAESMYNAASYIDREDSDLDNGGPRIIDSFGGVSLHKQSHGESFLSVVENRFGGNGIYILDEPEAALSPSRLLRLICNMKSLVDRNSQFIIATHSPILIASSWYPAEVAKEKFLKLDFMHIEYVMEMMSKNTTKVRNIKKYILAALFNAPSTISSYYRAEVNHDFPQYAAK